jgi:2-dehydro-3-deoxygluconokinase
MPRRRRVLARPLEVQVFRRHVVGAEANVAVSVTRLGQRAAFIGRVGNCGFGTAIVRRLRGEGVVVSALRVQAPARATTGLLIRERRAVGPAEGSYHLAWSDGSQLGPDDVTASDVAGISTTLGAREYLGG